MWLIFLLAAASLSFAQAKAPAIAENAADTSSANLATFADINIFSQMPLGSVLILWTDVDLSADIVRQITSRSFVLEPYFMQNIDREQFEQKRILHLFEVQKKEFFKLFPDEEDEE
ncbi:MAG: hypothetical protein LBH25_07640 [Fibromonadaceae bacterium]|jgi:hypothetical protein|nr:hypothetical protein [Fibromonadaceae bacterium]